MTDTTTTGVFTPAERAVWAWAMSGGDQGFKAAAAITLNTGLRHQMLPTDDLARCPYIDVDRRGAARPMWQDLVEQGGYLSGGEMLLAKLCESIAHGQVDDDDLARDKGLAYDDPRWPDRRFTFSLGELWRLDPENVAIVLGALEAYTWRNVQGPVVWVPVPVPADYAPWAPYRGGRFEPVEQS